MQAQLIYVSERGHRCQERSSQTQQITGLSLFHERDERLYTAKYEGNVIEMEITTPKICH